MFQRIALGIALVVGLLLFCTVCVAIVASMFVPGSAGGVLKAGPTLPFDRLVSVSAISWRIDVGFSGDTATIRAAGRTVLVEPTSLFVDGRRVAPIAAATKAVEVKIIDGQVVFIADGRPVECDAAADVIRK